VKCSQNGEFSKGKDRRQTKAVSVIPEMERESSRHIADEVLILP
jgi:hypothetical protein